VIHRLARCHLTPSRCARVLRTASPETCLSVSPSSKATSAAIESVQREARVPAKLPRRTMQQSPQNLGAFLVEGLAGSLRTRRFGRQGIRAPRVEVVDGVAHRLLAASQAHGYPRGTSSPLEEVRSICARRRVKASLERREASMVSRSFSENERTKIGAFMATTVTHSPKSILKLH
jgi:hypothetical protein